MDATGENLLREITFKTLLETLCRQVGASFWVTPDYIEIVEIEKAATSRVFKVLAVEDLIVPIPNAVNSARPAAVSFRCWGSSSAWPAATPSAPWVRSAAGLSATSAVSRQGGNQGGFNGQAGQLFQGGQRVAVPSGSAAATSVSSATSAASSASRAAGRVVDPATELVVLIQTVVDPGFWDPDVSFLSRNLLTGQNRTTRPATCTRSKRRCETR